MATKSVVLEDAATGSTDVGFGQAIALDCLVLRLLQHGMLWTNPSTRPPRSNWRSAIASRAAWLQGLTTAQNTSGLVHVQFVNGTERLVDLAAKEFRWVA
jgi:hypothetical protein